jgi:putative transposase
MPNHVHLVVVPERLESLGLLMQRLAGRYTRYFNERYRCSGTAWEERFHSTPIETDTYLLACCRYVDLNPVRGGIVASPGDYRWSSYNARVGLVRSRWLDEDPAFLEMGRSREERERRYEEWVSSVIPDAESERIREALRLGRLADSGTDFSPSPFSTSGSD